MLTQDLPGPSFELIVFTIFILAFFLLWDLFFANKEKREKLGQKFHHYKYYCKSGHYAGNKEPEIGTLCKTCVDSEAIRYLCSDCGPTKILNLVPRRSLNSAFGYLPRCKFDRPECRSRYATQASITENGVERTISLTEWVQRNGYVPREVPRLNIEKSSNVIQDEDLNNNPAELLTEWEKISKRYESQQQKINQELSALNRKQNGVKIALDLWAVLLGLCLALTMASDANAISIVLRDGITFIDKLGIMFQRLAEALNALFISGIVAGGILVAILAVILNRKPDDSEKFPNWNEFIGSTAVGLVVEVILRRTLSPNSPTIIDVVQILTIGSLPALIYAYLYSKRWRDDLQRLLSNNKQHKQEIDDRLSEGVS